MLRKFCGGLLFALLVAISPAHAQSFSLTILPGGCGTANYQSSLSYLTVDNTGKLCTAASVSASITGFQPASTGTPISVTTGGVTGSLPAGAVVVASNVGATNGAYCKLGASATTSDQLIPPNSWFAFTVGAATQLTCITSTSTTTVNMVGGSGLPTGAGGGGGGGGGGAITMASGAVASGAYSSGAYAAGALAAGSLASGAGVDGWDLTQGTKADAAWVSGSGSVISLLKNIAGGVAGSIPAGTNLIGGVNVAQINGVTVLTGTGATGTGAQRVTVSTDQATNAGAALVKGGVGVVNGGSFYQAVAASQTAATLQSSVGAAGDYLSHCVIYPTSTSPGAVTVFDSTNTAANSAILFAGGASSTSNLTPIAVPVGANSVNGAWKVTTGTAVSVVCYGKFS